jgi:hypothetical protein
MSIYDGDQQKSVSIVINGVHSTVSAVAAKTNAPANSVYTFSTPFSNVVNGQQIVYRNGSSYILDPALKATLLALGAPMAAA